MGEDVKLNANNENDKVNDLLPIDGRFCLFLVHIWLAEEFSNCWTVRWMILISSSRLTSKNRISERITISQFTVKQARETNADGNSKRKLDSTWCAGDKSCKFLFMTTSRVSLTVRMTDRQERIQISNIESISIDCDREKMEWSWSNTIPQAK